MNQQILFFFSALGAFNGILLCLYFLFWAKPKHPSNVYLGLLLGALSIRIGKSTFLFFNQGISKSFLQFGLTACFLIGPALYLFIRSRIEMKSNRLPKLLIGLMVFAFLVFGYFYTYESNPDFWRFKVVRSIYYQWIGFILLAGYLMKDTFQALLTKGKKLSSTQFMMLNIWIGVFLIWLAYFTSSYTSYIVGAVSFSFILYLSIVLIVVNNRKNSSIKKEKYANKKIPVSEAETLLSQIETLMQEDQLFKDSNLSLNKLAGHLNIRPHLLSQLLNDNLEKSFTQFLNEYRIEEAKKMLIDNQNLKIQAIAEICGFNSNSTFYTAFKKITHTTPAEFIKRAK